MDYVTSVDEAPEGVRDLFNRGLGAMERSNIDYAVEMFLACIMAEPMLLDARKFLRAVTIKRFKAKGDSPIRHVISTITGMPGMIAASLKIGSKPVEAIKTIEILLAKDPLNLRFLTLFSKAARAAEAGELAVQTLVIARENHPDNTKLILRLGETFMEMNRVSEARECFEVLVALRPNDTSAIRALKNAMALESITVDGWASVTEKRDGDYRDLLKDSAKAELLEKEDKITKSTKDTAALISNVLALIEEEPDNLTHYRELANLYTTNKMFDEAIEAINTAQEKRGSTDPELDAAVCNIRLKQFDHAIDEATKTGDDATAQQVAVDRSEFLFTNLQERARTYPNDLHIRYDLGVALLDREDYNGAIQQFQRSQRNPRYRTESLYCMGMCFKAKTQYDLAIEQLDSAASEIVGMNKLKKDIYYELGLVYEDLQDADKAAGYFKEIYQTDLGYKDVAQKVEQIYGSG